MQRPRMGQVNKHGIFFLVIWAPNVVQNIEVIMSCAVCNSLFQLIYTCLQD